MLDMLAHGNQIRIPPFEDFILWLVVAVITYWQDVFLGSFSNSDDVTTYVGATTATEDFAISCLLPFLLLPEVEPTLASCGRWVACCALLILDINVCHLSSPLSAFVSHV
jgi:hypothetical protein